MAAVTELSDFTEILPPGMAGLRLTTSGTTSTYVCPYFGEIAGAVANNESDKDGVGVGINGKTITITVGTAGDIITLYVWGRK